MSLLKTETPQCCSSAAPPLRLVFTRPSVKPMWASPIHTSCEMPTGGASRNHYTRSLCPTEHRKQAVLFKGQFETHKPPLSLDWEQREPQTHMCSNAAEIWSRRRGSCEGSRSSNKSWRAIKETHTHTHEYLKTHLEQHLYNDVSWFLRFIQDSRQLLFAIIILCKLLRCYFFS